MKKTPSENIRKAFFCISKPLLSDTKRNVEKIQITNYKFWEAMKIGIDRLTKAQDGKTFYDHYVLHQKKRLSTPSSLGVLQKLGVRQILNSELK